MNEIIDSGGNNVYEIPHMKKEKLTRLNELPKTIRVTNKALEYI